MTYIYRSMPVCTYRVQSPGFPKIVCEQDHDHNLLPQTEEEEVAPLST